MLSEWQKPVSVMLSDSGLTTRGGEMFFREIITTIKDKPEIIIRDVGYFLLEDKGVDIEDHILEFMGRTSFRYL
jgi:hypothetical protein